MHSQGGVWYMFYRKTGNKKYKVISDDGMGLKLTVPKYKKTNIWFGEKTEVQEKGLKVSGSEKFYIYDNFIVIDGYLAEIEQENKVEVKINGSLLITKENWEDIKNEIESLLYE